MSSTGTIKYDNHRDFLNVVRVKATVNTRYRENIVECPRTNDVVYRKGPASKYNTGNAYYRDLIEDHSLEHFTGDRNKKYNITRLVIKRIQSRGGRFLKWEDMWVVYQDEEVVRKKIASAFKQFNRNRKSVDSEQLVQAIKLATALNTDEETTDEETTVPKRPTPTEDEPKPENRHILSMEYAFVENPAKRLKTKGADHSIDDIPCIALTDDDIVCFGKCFIPTEFISPDLFDE